MVIRNGGSKNSTSPPYLVKNERSPDKKRQIVWFEYDRKADEIYTSFLYYTNEFDFVR